MKEWQACHAWISLSWSCVTAQAREGVGNIESRVITDSALVATGRESLVKENQHARAEYLYGARKLLLLYA